MQRVVLTTPVCMSTRPPACLRACVARAATMGDLLEEESAAAAAEGDSELRDAALLAAAEKCATQSRPCAVPLHCCLPPHAAHPPARRPSRDPLSFTARNISCRFARLEKLDGIRAGYWSARRQQAEQRAA